MAVYGRSDTKTVGEGVRCQLYDTGARPGLEMFYCLCWSNLKQTVLILCPAFTGLLCSKCLFNVKLCKGSAF